MPTPKPGEETQSEWMARCVPFVMDEGKERDAAVAQCIGMWEQATKQEPAMNRAYSILNVKQINEERRIIVGIATTPTADRMGDVVNPLGVQFKNPMPLLWQHKSDQPVGLAKFKKPTKDGIEFEAKLADIPETGNLKNRVDEAWHSVKHGLVRGVSIGFRPKKFAFMDDGGVDFQETEVMELSLVTIPANAEATIVAIKSADLQSRGFSIDIDYVKELEAMNRVALDQTERKFPALRVIPNRSQEQKMPRTIAEQIGAFESKRAASAARMTAIMEKAAAEDVTLEQAESEEYDQLELEIKNVDEHLVRLRKLENQQRQQLVVVDPQEEQRKAAVARPPAFAISVKPNCPPGIGFVRLAKIMMAGKGDTMRALHYAEEYRNVHPEFEAIIRSDIAATMRGNPQLMEKAIQQPGTTTDTAWASPLISYTQLASEYADLLRPALIMSKLNLRRVPFNIQLPAATSGASMGWVGESAPKPVTAMAFETIVLRWAKAAGIIVLTDELVRFSNPSAEAVVRDEMIKAMVQFLDRQFVDPTVAEVTNTSPASITNGVTPVTATGVNEAAFRTDVSTLINSFLANNYTLASGVWIMTQQQAARLSFMQNALSQRSFPDITPSGGTLMGFPVVASENVPATGGSPVDGYPIIFAIADEIMLADDGQTVIDASNQASLQMESAPDSPPTASTLLVSLWQANMVGLRAERWINWKKKRTTAVGYIQNAKYA